MITLTADPVVFFKLQLDMFIEGIRSKRLLPLVKANAENDIVVRDRMHGRRPVDD